MLFRCCLILCAVAACVPIRAQARSESEASGPAVPNSYIDEASLPDAPHPQTQAPDNGKVAPSNAQAPLSKQQPKRILGVMPNYRAVSAGAIPPPPTPKQALKIATENTFDYSSFAFVGITSLMAEGTDAQPELGKGVRGFGRYYWRRIVDKADGNSRVIFALPTVCHQDERYYAKGEGGFWK